jgi:hypothetical protein
MHLFCRFAVLAEAWTPRSHHLFPEIDDHPVQEENFHV